MPAQDDYTGHLTAEEYVIDDIVNHEDNSVRSATPKTVLIDDDGITNTVSFDLEKLAPSESIHVSDATALNCSSPDYAIPEVETRLQIPAQDDYTGHRTIGKVFIDDIVGHEVNSVDRLFRVNGTDTTILWTLLSPDLFYRTTSSVATCSVQKNLDQESDPEKKGARKR